MSHRQQERERERERVRILLGGISRISVLLVIPKPRYGMGYLDLPAEPQYLQRYLVGVAEPYRLRTYQTYTVGVEVSYPFSRLPVLVSIWDRMGWTDLCTVGWCWKREFQESHEGYDNYYFILIISLFLFFFLFLSFFLSFLFFFFFFWLTLV